MVKPLSGIVGNATAKSGFMGWVAGWSNRLERRLMSSIGIALISLICSFGGAWVGVLIRERLPAHAPVE